MQKVRNNGGGKEAEKKVLLGGVQPGALTVGSRFELKQSNTVDPSGGEEKERKKRK